MKKIGRWIFNHSLGIIIGGLIFGPMCVFATDTYLLNADDIEYDNTQSGSLATDVEGALDDLSSKADACNQQTYTAYSKGQELTINSEKYYVIADSSTSDDYVTLLKETPISNTASSYGSDSTYASSSTKTAVDTWAASTFSNNELKEVNNYEARLIQVEELTDLGCTSSNCTNSTHSWTYDSNYTYFTMSQYNNTITSVWAVGIDGSVAEIATSSQAMLRPVINLLKSAISS